MANLVQAASHALQAHEASLLDEPADLQPLYRLAELGQPPTNPDGRAAWQGGTHAIERCRATSH